MKSQLTATLFAAICTCVLVGAIFYSTNLNVTSQPSSTVTPTPAATDKQTPTNQTQTPTPTATTALTLKPTLAPTASPTPTYTPSPTPTPTPAPTVPLNCDYDSGWVNITEGAGKDTVITHNLNTNSYEVTITGKSFENDSEHTWELGSSDLMSGFNQTYGSYNTDGVYDMIKTDDGGYLLWGFVKGRQSWLIKIDAVGEKQWDRVIAGGEFSWGRALVKTSDGGYALIADQLLGNYQVWLIKVNADGQTQWNRTYGGPEDDYAHNIVADSDGGYTILGHTQSYGLGQNDLWLIKTDSAGNMLWNQTFGSAGNEQAVDLIHTNDGGYAIGGIGSPYTENEEYHYWLIKTDQDGNKLWDKVIGVAPNEFLCSVVQTSDGGYALAGRSVSLGNMVWLVKTDWEGNVLWSKSYGGVYYNDARCMIQTSDGGFAITGVTYVNRSTPENDSPNRMWVLKIDMYGFLQKTQIFPDTYSGEYIVENSDGSFTVAGTVWSNTGGLTDVLVLKTYLQSGLALRNATSNTITLYRDIYDIQWNYIRVTITKTA